MSHNITDIFETTAVKIVFDNSLIIITEEYRQRICVYPKLFMKDVVEIMKNSPKDHKEYEKRISTTPDEIIVSGEQIMTTHGK